MSSQQSQPMPEAQESSNFDFSQVVPSPSRGDEGERHIMEMELEEKSGEPRRPRDNVAMDTKVSWIVCICCSLANVIIIGSLYTYAIVFPKILEEFQEGKARTAMVASVGMGLYTFLCPVAAKLSARFGCRVVMVTSGLTCALGLLGSSFTPNLYVLFVSYGVLIGTASAMVCMASWEMIPLYFETHRYAATGIISVGPWAGVLVMGLVTQSLLDHFNWRKTFLVLATINLLPSILGCIIKRTTTTTEREVDKKTSQNVACCRCLKVVDLTVFKDSYFMILSISVAIAALGNNIPFVHLVKYAEENGIPGHRSSWMFFAIGASSMVARLLTGKLCETGWIPHLRLYQLAVVIYAVADIIVPLATTFKTLLVYSVVLGVCDGTLATSNLCIFVSLYAGTPGLGWALFFQGFSYFASPALAGFISDESGSYHPAFYTAGGILVLAACLSEFTRCIKPNNQHGRQTSVEVEREGLVMTGEETVCQMVDSV